MSFSDSTTLKQYNDLLNLLDSEAQDVINFALQEAQRINHFWVGVEHLFMGLTRQSDGLTVRLLKHVRIDPQHLQGYIRVTAGIGDPRYKIPPVPSLGKGEIQGIPLGPPLEKGEEQGEGEAQMVITPRLLDILKRARVEAQKQGKPLISPEQLLLAILEERESIPIRILQKLGLDPSQLLEIARKEEKLPEVEEVFPPAPEPVGRRPTPAPSQEGKDIPTLSQAESGLTRKFIPTPTLDRYSRDLTQLACKGKLHPAIGREEILGQIAHILTQQGVNNPLLIGEAGVGKTAIVEGFAYRLAEGKVIPQLQDKRIVELQVVSLVSGTKGQGELEERVSKILQEIKAAPELIVFVDKIHTIMGGGIGSSMELANHFKPALIRGEFPCIGSTTLAEYQKYIERDAALARRFERIDVKEPDLETCKEILREMQILLEEHHNVKIHFSAIKAAVELSARYVPQEKLPAKAVRLLEKACSLTKIKSLTPGKEDMATRRFLMVNENMIRQVLSEKTGIPLNHLTLDE
jgi:ATP-dependent Clp protease ATP-binding subunit ClpC